MSLPSHLEAPDHRQAAVWARGLNYEKHVWQCTYEVTMWNVRVTIVVFEK
jgi:hypothetical protein